MDVGDELTLRIATWNINSVRLRAGLVCRFLRDESPDVLCLQELKSPAELIVTDDFREAGYPHHVIRGQKAYNGVAILSRFPLEDRGSVDFLGRGEARHVAAELENGLRIENFYVPAGGYEPDPEINPKFADKLKFVKAMAKWGRGETRRKTVLVGDLNIAPLEQDVWSHKQLINVVSHTPREVNLLLAAMKAGDWTDIVRKDLPEEKVGKLFSWWSYRARDWNASDRGRRLDHIWATPDLVRDTHHSRILRESRGWLPKPSDHVPVMASFEL